MALSQSERQVPPLVYPPPARADLDALTEDMHRMVNNARKLV